KRPRRAAAREPPRSASIRASSATISPGARWPGSVPELPEVETIVRDLSRLVEGATIERVEVERPDLIRGDADAFARAIRGRTIDRISRRAKNIVVALGDDRLVINLGMTGNLLALVPDAPSLSHEGIRFHLDGGRRMVYRDIRRFGRLEVLSDNQWETRQQQL